MKKRCIYSYEFEDNFVYVGLTYNTNDRKRRHKKSGSVYEHINICSAYTFKILTDYIDVNDAKFEENNFVEKYNKNGWNILNKSKTGSIGSNIVIWNYEKCKETALKYKNRKDLKKDFQGCYIRINREKWKELFNHMENGKIVWTKEKCIEEAKKYNNYSDYRNNSKSYNAAIKYKILDEIGILFNRKKSKYKYWTKNKCAEESKKYNNLKDFSTKSSVAYTISVRNKWLNDISIHLKRKLKNYWTKDKCAEEAKKYNNLKDFSTKSSGAYHAAFLNNWMEDICKHFNYKKRVSPNYWTKEKCIEEAKKYTNKKDFIKNSINCYRRCSKNGWLNEINTYFLK